jgi:hypothetical protein
VDISQVASFFDLQDFDAYDFNASAWLPAAFKGQLKLADKFLTIYNRPTRNRMIYVAPGQEPTSPVIRVSNTGDIFMLKTPQRDSHANTHYRTVIGGHMPAGTAVVNRLLPIGPPEDPGWAVQAMVMNTFADVELRSVNENTDRQLLSYGHFIMLTPSNTDLQDHDTVTITDTTSGDVTTYYVLESYVDSGLQAARVTSQPDERVNMIYTSVGEPVYDPDQSANVRPETHYNVTGRITIKKIEEEENSDVPVRIVEVMVRKNFIGLIPKIGDKLTFQGRTFTIHSVGENALRDEWTLEASA